MASLPAKAEEERPIAVVRGSTILYGDIRCRSHVASAEQCRQHEQASLRKLIAEHVIECAAGVRRITLTAEDEQQIEKQVADERDAVRRMTDRHLAVLRGVLRVQEGESLEAVAADLAPAGVRSEDIETQLRYLDDAGATREALATDYPASAAAATRAVMRQMLLLRRLREHIAERALAAGRAPEEEERALLESAVQSCSPRIVDHQYQMPDLRGVFKRHVQQTQIR